MGVRKLGLRYGMYTDDTQTTLALATSIVEKQGLDPGHTGIHRVTANSTDVS
jgi:ADP-ribosylglycohydrolase